MALWLAQILQRLYKSQAMIISKYFHYPCIETECDDFRAFEMLANIALFFRKTIALQASRMSTNSSLRQSQGIFLGQILLVAQITCYSFC